MQTSVQRHGQATLVSQTALPRLVQTGCRNCLSAAPLGMEHRHTSNSAQHSWPPPAQSPKPALQTVKTDTQHSPFSSSGQHPRVEDNTSHASPSFWSAPWLSPQHPSIIDSPMLAAAGNQAPTSPWHTTAQNFCHAGSANHLAGPAAQCAAQHLSRAGSQPSIIVPSEHAWASPMSRFGALTPTHNQHSSSMGQLCSMSLGNSMAQVSGNVPAAASEVKPYSSDLAAFLNISEPAIPAPLGGSEDDAWLLAFSTGQAHSGSLPRLSSTPLGHEHSNLTELLPRNSGGGGVISGSLRPRRSSSGGIIGSSYDSMMCNPVSGFFRGAAVDIDPSPGFNWFRNSCSQEALARAASLTDGHITPIPGQQHELFARPGLGFKPPPLHQQQQQQHFSHHPPLEALSEQPGSDGSSQSPLRHSAAMLSGLKGMSAQHHAVFANHHSPHRHQQQQGSMPGSPTSPAMQHNQSYAQPALPPTPPRMQRDTPLLSQASHSNQPQSAPAIGGAGNCTWRNQRSSSTGGFLHSPDPYATMHSADSRSADTAAIWPISRTSAGTTNHSRWDIPPASHPAVAALIPPVHHQGIVASPAATGAHIRVRGGGDLHASSSGGGYRTWNSYPDIIGSLAEAANGNPTISGPNHPLSVHVPPATSAWLASAASFGNSLPAVGDSTLAIFDPMQIGSPSASAGQNILYSAAACFVSGQSVGGREEETLISADGLASMTVDPGSMSLGSVLKGLQGCSGGSPGLQWLQTGHSHNPHSSQAIERSDMSNSQLIMGNQLMAMSGWQELEAVEPSYSIALTATAAASSVLQGEPAREATPEAEPQPPPPPATPPPSFQPTSRAYCRNCTMSYYGPTCTTCGASLSQQDWPPPAQSALSSGQTADMGSTSATLLAYDNIFMQHTEAPPLWGSSHPERPDRVLAIMQRLRETGLLARCQQARCRAATTEELTAVHSPDLLQEVDAAAVEAAAAIAAYEAKMALPGASSSSVFGEEDGEEEEQGSASRRRHIRDCYFNGVTASCAKVAAGSSVEVAVAVAKGLARNGAAIIRPPGHHAESSVAMGFCYFNNAAVAARAAQQAGAKKVLIMDFDVHHGNGTQHIFEQDPTVLYISTHRRDHGYFFPGTGAAEEVGCGAGLGYTVNIPWDGGGANDADYVAAFQHVVLPVSKAFQPDLVIVSAGFDAVEGDPLGGCALSPEAFGWMTATLESVGPIVLLLEGGYNLTATAAATEQCMRVLLGEAAPQLQCLHGMTHVGVQGVKGALEANIKHWDCLHASAASFAGQAQPLHIGLHHHFQGHSGFPANSSGFDSGSFDDGL